jgi:hypothetical protein
VVFASADRLTAEILRSTVLDLLAKARPSAFWQGRVLFICAILVAAIVTAFAIGLPAERDRRVVMLSQQLDSEVQSATRNATPPLPASSFVTARRLISAIDKLYPRNGTVLYYRGLIERWTEKPEELDARADDDFFNYIETEKTLPHSQTRTGAGRDVCYTTPSGYCLQRTAWISQELAYDYLRRGQRANDSATRKRFLMGAVTYAKTANELWRGGFDQGIPAPVIVENAEAELRKKSAGNGQAR